MASRKRCITEAERAQNIARALDMRIRGASCEQIAERLGVSVATAWRYVEGALSALRERTIQDAQALRDLQQRRLDDMLVGLMQKAREGDVAAVAAVLKIEERRAKLLGLDGPARIEHIIPDSPRAALASALAAIAPRPTSDDGG